MTRVSVCRRPPSHVLWQNRDGYPSFLDHLQGRVADVLMFHPDQADEWRAALARASRSR